MNSWKKDYNKSNNTKEKVADTHDDTHDVDEVEYVSENSSVPEKSGVEFSTVITAQTGSTRNRTLFVSNLNKML